MFPDKGICNMKKWLIWEAVVLTFIPVMLLMYALPYLLLGLVAMLFNFTGDVRYLFDLVFGFFSYVGGALGICVIWRCALYLMRGKVFRLDFWFVMAGAGGVAVTWELIVTTNWFSVFLVCLPPWGFVVHLLCLRKNMVCLNH
ncbi:MAG: hypothetical protein QM617_00590 [Comamonas sp.]